MLMLKIFQKKLRKVSISFIFGIGLLVLIGVFSPNLWAQGNELPTDTKEADVKNTIDTMLLANNLADGQKQIYALIIAGSNFPTDNNWKYPLEFYEILAYDYGVPAENITFLANMGGPAGYENIVDGNMNKETILLALDNINAVIDADDMFIFYINAHGQGYLGYDPDRYDNIAYHGFFYSKPQINELFDGDKYDYLEQDLEWSIFCASGILDGNDKHFGLGEWGVSYYYNHLQNKKGPLNRVKYLSNFTDIYIEGIGPVSDSDVYIEKFTDYTLGDLNKDGIIDPDAGEVYDYDNDGIPPFDLETRLFDEDDWGQIDKYQDNWQDPHSQLGGIPFTLFDANLDNKVDADLYPTGSLEVDGTDIDNDGCIEGIDLNDDGDMGDWVAIDESISVSNGAIIDDELVSPFNNMTCAVKVLVFNTCYGGGFINDLSGPQTIIITGTNEISRSGAANLQYFNKAFIDHYDPNADSQTTFDEVFEYMVLHPGMQYGVEPALRYDDNADGIGHNGILPIGEDGVLGEKISLIDWTDDDEYTSTPSIPANLRLYRRQNIR